MKTITIFALALLTVSVIAGPSKRFAGFGGLSGALSAVGGNLGCVVTNNQLYVNGLFEKDLSSDEQEEFKEYKTQLAEFKQEIRQIIAERKQKALENRNNMISTENLQENNSSLPQPPAKPSFCKADVTTQYIFDGCKVQNNKLYVGSQFARNLTEEEVQELKEFDEKMTSYQHQLTQSLQEQVKEIFGSQFAQLFGGHKENESTTPVPEETATAAPLEAPEAPNFCTIIF